MQKIAIRLPSPLGDRGSQLFTTPELPPLVQGQHHTVKESKGISTLGAPTVKFNSRQRQVSSQLVIFRRHVQTMDKFSAMNLKTSRT